MDINAKLIDIQSNLKAPKSQYNSFGKYNYRNCEDILEAVKPLLAKNGLTLRLSDEVINIGARYYVKATATLSNGENEICVTALAREEENKKGMDASQITGSASSYARKYALNGLFAIDDTKDADGLPNNSNSNNNSKGNKPTTNKNTVKKTQATQSGNGSQNLSNELKEKINKGLTKYKELTGIHTKEILSQIENTLGYAVNNITTDKQAIGVVNLLAKMCRECQREGA